MNAANNTRTISIGRGPENDIVIDGASVSRHHALMIESGGSYWIQDNNSANGVFVNGERVTSLEVFPSDRITLGTNNELNWQSIYQAFNVPGGRSEETYRENFNNGPAYAENPVYPQNHQPYPQPAKKSNSALWVALLVAFLLLGGVGLYFLLRKDDGKIGNKPVPTEEDGPAQAFLEWPRTAYNLSDSNYLEYCDCYEKEHGSYTRVKNTLTSIYGDGNIGPFFGGSDDEEKIRESELRVTNKDKNTAVISINDSWVRRMAKIAQEEEGEEMSEADIESLKEAISEIKFYLIRENGRWKRYLREDDAEYELYSQNWDLFDQEEYPEEPEPYWDEPAPADEAEGDWEEAATAEAEDEYWGGEEEESDYYKEDDRNEGRYP